MSRPDDISNNEPPVDPRNWLHYVLVGLNLLTHIPPLGWVLIILLIAAGVGWAWHTVAGVWPAAWIAGAGSLIALVADWVWLESLPRRGVSFGPVAPPLAGLCGVRALIGLAGLPGMWMQWPAVTCAAASIPIHLLASAAIWYATRIEPFRLGITRLSLATDKLPPDRHLRLVQISDLHVERITQREQELIRQVNALNADYILLTGDYLNFSYIGEARAIADARQVLGALRARCGIYAVRGTHQVDPNALMPALFDGLPVRWLRNEHIIAGNDGAQIALVGVTCSRDRRIDTPAMDQAIAGLPDNLFRVLLYHMPDLAAEAQVRGIDLYLAGHTHGGQIRMPIYGALVTGTHVGKKYEMGLYRVQNMTMYVSRGIGMEGKAAPRARFLCPPEIVCVDMSGCSQPSTRIQSNESTEKCFIAEAQSSQRI